MARRGHGTLEDASLVDEIKRRGLGLTTCPISNSYVAGEPDRERYLDALASYAS